MKVSSIRISSTAVAFACAIALSGCVSKYQIESYASVDKLTERKDGVRYAVEFADLSSEKILDVEMNGFEEYLYETMPDRFAKDAEKRVSVNIVNIVSYQDTSPLMNLLGLATLGIFPPIDVDRRAMITCGVKGGGKSAIVPYETIDRICQSFALVPTSLLTVYRDIGVDKTKIRKMERPVVYRDRGTGGFDENTESKKKAVAAMIARAVDSLRK